MSVAKYNTRITINLPKEDMKKVKEMCKRYDCTASELYGALFSLTVNDYDLGIAIIRYRQKKADLSFQDYQEWCKKQFDPDR